MKILYTTGKALWLAENGRAVELPSYRALQYRETIQQIHESKVWKTTGRGAQFMGVADETPSMEDTDAYFGGVALYRDMFLYTLQLDASSGMYQRNFEEAPKPEGHIISGNDMQLGAIASNGDDVAAVLHYPNGRSHIGLFHLPQSYCTELTDGDSAETSPSWTPDGKLLFSTCGVALGGRLVYSPASVIRYNPHTKSMETILEDEKYDYLSPKSDTNSNLWYIRQPYSPGEEEHADFGSILLDVILFPFRLVKAIFGFLNVFSIMFGHEPLQSGGNRTDVKSKQKSEKELFFEGSKIQAEKNLKENKRSGEDFPGILPHNRVLVCRQTDGTETVIAKGVLDYCLCSDGVVYSNGSHILHCPADGKPESIAKVRLASKLQVIEG